MIVNFRDEKTEKLFSGELIPKINNKLAQKARRRLELLNAAQRFVFCTFRLQTNFIKISANKPPNL